MNNIDKLFASMEFMTLSEEKEIKSKWISDEQDESDEGNAETDRS